MGLLIIPNCLYDNEQDAEFLFTALDWLKHECKATRKECSTYLDYLNNRTRFLIEGDGIPKGDLIFDIECCVVVEKVLSFKIKDYDSARTP